MTLCALLGMGAGHFVVWLSRHKEVIAAGIALPIDNEYGFYHALDQLEERVLGQPVQLVADDLVWPVVGLEHGVRLDRSAMWQEATGRRPGETAIAHFTRLRLSSPKSRQLAIHITYDNSRLDAHISSLGAKLWRPARNARINGNGTIQPEAPGRSIDVATTRRRLLNAWQQGSHIVIAQVNQLQPATTQEALNNIDARYILARYSSYFDNANEGRVANIQTAAQLLDGVIVQSGQEFSFNTVIGPRSLERGFKMAEEIVNQEMTLGIGGGVCQVSSTLYNAVLLSGASITKRQNHSRPLGYVAIGRDATVYYGVIDFRFRNPYSFPLVLSAEVIENKLSVAVYAPMKPAVEYSIIVTDVMAIPAGEQLEISASVLPGQTITVKPGRQGWEARTWRVATLTGGIELYREEISHDRYPPQPALVQVNPGAFRPVQGGE